jgi:hypothetical protein
VYLRICIYISGRKNKGLINYVLEPHTVRFVYTEA